MNDEDVTRSRDETGAARTKTMGEEEVNRAEDGRVGCRGRVVVAAVLAVALVGAAVLMLVWPGSEHGGPVSGESTADQEDPVGGGSSGQAPATTSSPPGGSLVVRDARDMVLRPDGIGQVGFGATPETAIAAITAMFGPPSEPLQWGTFCGFTDASGRALELGYATWGVLTLQFDQFEGPARLSGWRLTSLGVQSSPIGPTQFATPDGISIATTVAEVQALHPEAVFEYSEPFNDHRAMISFDGDDVLVSALLPGEGRLIVNLSAGLLSCA